MHSSDRPNNPEVVGFVATIIHFGAASKSGLPRMREHRTVVLPQYQVFLSSWCIVAVSYYSGVWGTRR
jgi:hypothetical protein